MSFRSSALISARRNPKPNLFTVLNSDKEQKTFSKSATAFKVLRLSGGVKSGESIEHDWGAVRREELYRKDIQAYLAHDPTYDFSGYTIEDWLQDIQLAVIQVTMNWVDLPEELAPALFERAEEARKVFYYEPTVKFNGVAIGIHPVNLVPYPLAYDPITMENDRLSHELLKKIYYGWPSIHRFQFVQQPPKRVLDLGCGDGSWIFDAARCWKETKFYGIDVQGVYPRSRQLAPLYGAAVAKNVKFISFNFLLDKLPFFDGVFDMVRMANLKWCIPEDKWDELLKEVHRVTARAGLVEIIDDDFVIHTDPDNVHLTDEDMSRCLTLQYQFVKFLFNRQLVLDTHEFMVQKLKKYFPTSVHEDVIPIAISPEMSPVSPRAEKAFKTTKAGKRRSNRRSVGTAESGKPLRRMISRLRSNSDFSDDSDEEDQEKNVETEGVERPLPPKPQPRGLFLPTLNRTIPLTGEEIIAHATRNMQLVLSAKEVFRRDIRKKTLAMFIPPELETTWEFNETFWTFERTMNDRLNINIPRCRFDPHLDDLEEGNDALAWVEQAEEEILPVSTVGQMKNGDDFSGDDDCESIAEKLMMKHNVDKLVRVIRVYTMWK